MQNASVYYSLALSQQTEVYLYVKRF